MHLALLFTLENSNPNLLVIQELYQEYNELTRAMDSEPALRSNMRLQALNARVLAALTRKSLDAIRAVGAWQ